jgi:hypothetical protein
MENTIANIRILDVVRLVHGYQYFIFVFLIINMLFYWLILLEKILAILDNLAWNCDVANDKFK